MTSLEQTLAAIHASITHARATGNSQVLAGLLARKQAICAALAAPEHGWHDPREHAAPDVLPRPKAA